MVFTVTAKVGFTVTAKVGFTTTGKKGFALTAFLLFLLLLPIFHQFVELNLLLHES